MNERPTSDLVSPVLFLGDCLVSGTFGRALAALPEEFPDVECFVINLESAVAGPDAPRARKSYPLVASYEAFVKVLEAFRGRKVVFNQANNHSADAGLAAKETFFRWCGERGIVLLDQSGQAEVELSCGTRLRLCAGWDTNSERAQGPVTSWTLPAAGKLEGQTVAVFLAHWGEEYVFFPSPRQVQAARAVWNAGFHLIVGCHPHVVQGCATQAGRQAYYSLGNGTMYLDCMLPGSRLGAALRCDFHQAGRFESQLHPFTVSDMGELHFLDQTAAHTFRGLVQELSTWPDGAWWWQRQAAQAFFRNHMASWRKRIRQHGFWEFARMLKAFASRSYCGMGAAWLTGIGRTPLNALTAERLHALGEHGGRRLQPDTSNPTSERA
jgi:hypothetical protein